MSEITVNRGSKEILIEGKCGSKWAGSCKVVKVTGEDIVLDCDTQLVDECPDMETERLIDEVMHDGDAEASSTEIAERVEGSLKGMGIGVSRSGKTVSLSGDRPGGSKNIVIMMWRGVLDRVLNLPDGWNYEVIDWDTDDLEVIEFYEKGVPLHSPTTVQIHVKSGVVTEVKNMPEGYDYEVRDEDDPGGSRPGGSAKKFIRPGGEGEVNFGKDLTINEHGYETAKGTVGTGWMKFNESDIKEVLERSEPDPLDKADEFAREWLETEQWNYEVNDKIEEETDKEFNKEEDSEGWHYQYFENQSYWVAGYATFVLEQMKSGDQPGGSKKTKVVTGAEAEKIANKILKHDGVPYPKPHISGYFPEGGKWTAFDNTAGEMFMEDFWFEKYAKLYAENLDLDPFELVDKDQREYESTRPGGSESVKMKLEDIPHTLTEKGSREIKGRVRIEVPSEYLTMERFKEDHPGMPLINDLRYIAVYNYNYQKSHGLPTRGWDLHDGNRWWAIAPPDLEVDVYTYPGGARPGGRDPGVLDEHTARELYLYAVNTSDIYFGRLKAFIDTYANKKKRGVYDETRAVEGLANLLAKDIQKRYWKDHGEGPVPEMSQATKMQFGRELLDSIEEAIDEAAGLGYKPEMVELYARVTEDGYLGYATDSDQGLSESYWPDHYEEGGAEFSTVKIEVPEEMVDALLKQGSSEQYYSDGYEAWQHVLRKGNVEE